MHAAAKIFGHHAAEISSSWSAEQHEQSKNLLSSVKDGLQPFAAHPDIETQERAAELLVLLSFVEADLVSHVPTRENGSADLLEVEGGFEESKDDPPYPKSLFLFQPLFTAYELNAVAYKAQNAVRLPESLDLDRDFVPGGGFANFEVDELELESEPEKGLDLGDEGGAGMDELRRVLREQDEKDRKKSKKGKGRRADGEILTLEEKEEKQRVGDMVTTIQDMLMSIPEKSSEEGESQGRPVLPIR